jgi:hypothetical protein
LSARGTEDLSRADLYFAVESAAAAVAEVEALTDVRALFWEKLYRRAGGPELMMEGEQHGSR